MRRQVFVSLTWVLALNWSVDFQHLSIHQYVSLWGWFGMLNFYL